MESFKSVAYKISARWSFSLELALQVWMTLATHLERPTHICDMIEAVRLLSHELKWLHASSWSKLRHLGHAWLWASWIATYLWNHVLHLRVLAQWHELEIGSQALFVCKERLDGLLVLRDESRLCKTIFLVLDQLAEVDHETPWVGA